MTTQTSVDTDIATIRSGFEAVEKGDLSAFRDMFHPDATWNHRNDDRFAGVHRGSAAIVAFVGESAQLSTGTLRPAPLSIMSDGRGLVAVLVHLTAARPDGRELDDRQILLFALEDGRVRSVDQFVGDPTAVAAFWS